MIIPIVILGAIILLSILGGNETLISAPQMDVDLPSAQEVYEGNIEFQIPGLDYNPNPTGVGPAGDYTGEEILVSSPEVIRAAYEQFLLGGAGAAPAAPPPAAPVAPVSLIEPVSIYPDSPDESEEPLAGSNLPKFSREPRLSDEGMALIN